MLKEPGGGGGGGGTGTRSKKDMASMPHTSLVDPNSFNNPSVDHSSPNSACFPNTLLPEFDGHGHLPLGKFQQELAQAWQTPSPHLDKPIKIPNNSFSFTDARLLSAFSMEALSNPHTFSDSGELPASGSWEAGVGQKLTYASSLGTMLPVSNSSMNLAAQGMGGGSEFVGDLGSNAGSNGAMASLMGTSPRLSEKGKHMNMVNSNWVSINAAGNVGLTVDPSKGALAIQGMNLAASHCLASFSTDPGFAERAAKSSCFSSQNYSELAQPFGATDGPKMLNRSSARASGPKLTRVSSGHLTPRCSAPNSPVGGTRSGASQDPNSTPENAYLKATQDAATALEEPRRLEKRSGRGSSSPSRIDGSEGTQKLCTSLNESDEADGSLGQEVSSSCERGGGFENASQGLTEIPGKRRRIGSKDRSKDASRATNQMDVKDGEMDEEKAKRHKSGENAKEDDKKQKVEQSNSGNSGDTTPKSVKESSKPPEAPKPDYIHVRARRGQATDSHSLAERVRREKISERMKFLQDLVPGCSKVTGKAVMLDEIINYVQSLQRQVEFLSMKLAAVNPRLEFNVDSLFGKEMIQPRGIAPTLHFAPENTNSYPPIHQQAQGSLQVGGSCPPVDVHSLGSDSALRRSISLPQAPMDAYGDSVSQISQAWDDELQSVVQMGFAQGRQTPLSSPGIPGRLFPGQMKVEL